MDCGFIFQRQRNSFFGNSHVLCAVGVLVKLRNLSALRQYSVASGRKLGLLDVLFQILVNSENVLPDIRINGFQRN